MDLPIKVKLAIAATHMSLGEALCVGETSSIVNNIVYSKDDFGFSINGRHIEVEVVSSGMLVGSDIVVHPIGDICWLGDVRLLSYGDPNVYKSIGRLEVHKKGVVFIENSPHSALISALQIYTQEVYSPSNFKVYSLTLPVSPVCTHYKDGVHYKQEVVLGICRALKHLGVSALASIQGVDDNLKGFLIGKTKNGNVVSIYTTPHEDGFHIEVNLAGSKYSCLVYMDNDNSVWITEDKTTLQPNDLQRFIIDHDIYYNVADKIRHSFGISGNAIYL